MQFFRNDLEGVFIERPNRFIVIAETPAGRIRAHCPNPGRLIEILIPGRKLIFEKSDNPNRKTLYSLAAAYYCGKIIPLNSAGANKAAEQLAIPVLFPAADKVIPEQKHGKSRFDFLILQGESRTYLEVKSCTLVEEGRAMFPDAPTKRGARHLNELIEIEKNESGTSGRALFLITHEDAEVFTPNFHTDPYFAETLQRAIDTIRVDFVSIACDSEGCARLVNQSVPVDMTPVKFAQADSGIYMVIVKLDRHTQIPTGKLAVTEYLEGYYIYAGSAKQGLSKRVGRHKNKKKKKFHWHIDYLTAAADSIKTFSIYTGEFTECDIAKRLARMGGNPVPNFGSSDCCCGSHLFYFKDDPVKTDPFLKLLHHFRHHY